MTRIDKGEKTACSLCGNWTAGCKRTVDHILTPCARTNPKWKGDPKVTPETIKLAQIEVGSNLLHTARAVF